MGTPPIRTYVKQFGNLTENRNPWQVLQGRWKDDISARLQGAQWSWFGNNNNFKRWHAKYYPTLSSSVCKAGSLMSNNPDANRSSEAVCRTTFCEWWFNHRINTKERNSLVLVMAKLRLEDLLNWFSDLHFVGANCEILFRSRKSAEDFHQHLLRNGYGDWWSAKESGDPWGVRSRFAGLQLHFRGRHHPAGTLVDAHIDTYNPGDPSQGPPTGAWSELGGAVEHYFRDKVQRSTIDDPAKVWLRLRGLASSRGISLPWVP